QLADIGSIVGGNFNANTREGLTQYLFTVPSEDLDVALHIEALRLRAVLDSPEEWRRERGAIEQEVAQDLSEPGYVLFERLRARMFAGTPYEHTPLGTRPSFEKTTARMLRSFHDTWYAPNNALLVIAGDVDPPTALAEVKRLFGDIAPKKLPAKPRVRLRPVHPTSFALDTDRPSGTLMIALRTPGPRDADFAALEVLSDVLSSRRFDLYGLVPAGKALGAEFALDPLPEAGLAYAVLSFTAGADPKALEHDARAILARVAREGVPPELVEAAKLQERSAAQFQRNSIAELASVWSEALALYGLASPDEDLERIERVTAADVNRVARRYLDLDHAVTGVMLPRGSGRPIVTHGGFGGQESISLGEAHPTALPSWAQKALERLEVPPSTLHPVVSTPPNGLPLIVQSEDVSDTVSVYRHIRNRPETEHLTVAAGNASPGFLTQRSLRAALFPPDDPRLPMPTAETVRALTPAAVRSYYTRVFRPDLATIVVIGKVTSAAAREAIEKYFGAWTASGPPPGIDLPRAPPNGPGTVTVPDQSRVQDRVG